MVKNGYSPTVSGVWKDFEKGLAFNVQTGFSDTVQTNENFFIGKQWEGVLSNGLPTPVFNFLKRVVLFTVAGITSSCVKMQASAMPDDGGSLDMGEVTDTVNHEFERLFEENKLLMLMRELLRNTAVDGDGCTYTYWDPDAPSGQFCSGAVVTEVIENSRVFFGNTSDRRVERQPYILIMSREMTDDVRARAKKNGCADLEMVKSDTDERKPDQNNAQDELTTVLLKLWRDSDTGTIWCYECTKNAEIRKAWDTGLTRYPITWLNWDYVQDSYHGQAMVTGLIPNQIFINKLYAMSMISLMTTAYPKIVYDKTRVSKWDNRVGAAIPVQGGDVNSVARIIDPAQISPQIAQFIQMAKEDTLSALGATSVALGDARPDNTSAIIALQKAAAVPNELTRQNLYQNLEDLGRIYIDFMGEYYGTRRLDTAGTVKQSTRPVGNLQSPFFNFDVLKTINLSLKLDVGASSYWSEIAAMQTLDNLLMRGKIDLIDYLERVPDGYIIKKQELLDKLESAKAGAAQPGMTAPFGMGNTAGAMVQPAMSRPGMPTIGAQAEQLQQLLQRPPTAPGLR
ncbi:hypothetical protein IZU99_03075 [Oscillospiraceae bacterium CM]|nr:hypothetical protein IZU99_03075 [Oscillospiraceae bacterium CM]